jgi:hypothetical protein
LLLYEVPEVPSSRAECLRFKEITEGAWTGTDGVKSFSLESGMSLTTSFTAEVLGGPIPPLVATTGLLLEAINGEFAMVPRV